MNYALTYRMEIINDGEEYREKMNFSFSKNESGTSDHLLMELLKLWYHVVI